MYMNLLTYLLTCGSPTGATSDCLNVERVHRRYVALLTSRLLAAGRTVGHYVGFPLSPLRVFFSSVNRMMLTCANFLSNRIECLSLAWQFASFRSRRSDF